MTISAGRWPSPPVDLRLFQDEVHIWRASLDQPSAKLEQWRQILATDELDRANRFHFDEHRRHFIAARGMLRVILGRYLELDPAQLRFAYTAYGKPALAEPFDRYNLQFNLSHSHNVVLYALTYKRDIGIDLEYIGRKIELKEIAQRFFSPNEASQLLALPAHLHREAFFNCWTRKEAFIKAKGDGLSLPLDQFEVSLIPNEPAVLLSTHYNPADVTRWSLRTIAPGPGYAGAVVVEGHDWQLKCWQWSS